MARSLRSLCSLAIVLALASAAHAATPAEKCRATIIKNAGKYVAAVAKTLGKCNEALLKDKPGFGPAGALCDDAKNKTTAKIAKAETKLRAAIDKACGGGDKFCEETIVTANKDVPLADIGWDIGQCQNFEKGACLNAIADCADVADCLLCVNDAAIDQAQDLYYGSLVLPSVGDKALNKCQKEIGKSTLKFLIAKSKILGKCWAAVEKGKIAGPCPDGDTKSLEKIAKAEAKKVAAICKKCGGPDKACDADVTTPSGTVITGSGGSDDTTPGAIGFVGACDDITIPGGAACAQPVTNLAELVECVDCVTEFKVDCMDEVSVPQHVLPVSPECNLGCGDGIVDGGAGEQCESPGDCAVGEDCNSLCLCEVIPPLGQRTFSLNTATSDFYNGFLPDNPVAAPSGSLVLDADFIDPVTGQAAVTLAAGGPYYITSFIALGGGQTICNEIQSCAGFVDCDGGTNVDGTQEVDSLDPASAPCVQDGSNGCPNLPSSVCCSNSCEGGFPLSSGNLQVPTQSVNATDSGAGALSMLCDVRSKVINGAVPVDCTLESYVGLALESMVFTTGTATARALQHCVGTGAPPEVAPELGKTGANFDCSDWTTENGPGTIVFATPTEEPSPLITGDSSSVIIMDD